MIRGRWFFAVDHRRSMLVLLGSMDTPVATLGERALALQLGPSLYEPEFESAASQGDPSSTRRDWELDDPYAGDELVEEEVSGSGGTRHWLGLEGAIGSGSYREESGSSSCGGPVTIYDYDKETLGGWLRYDAQVPLPTGARASLGGRGGYASGSDAVRRSSERSQSETRTDDKRGFLNAWAEFENPGFAIGIAFYGAFASTETVSSPMTVPTTDTSLNLRVGGHLRAGSIFGLDVGYLDRDALLGITTLRAGFGGLLGRGATRIARLDDVRGRYGFGHADVPDPGRTVGRTPARFLSPRRVHPSRALRARLSGRLRRARA